MAKKRRRRRRNLLIYLITVILSIVYIFAGHKIATRDLELFSADEGIASVEARVTAVTDRQQVSYEMGGETSAPGTNIYFTAKLLQGENQGQEVKAVQTIDPYFASRPEEVTPGKKVLIMENQDELYEAGWIMIEYIRTDALIWLGVLFAVCLFLFGRIQGINTMVSLLFTILSIFVVFIPGVLAGKNVYVWSAVTCLFVIVMTLLIVNGANKKSLAAGIGCLFGMGATGLLTLIMDRIIRLTGVIDEESIYLQTLQTSHPIDLKAIIFAAILIGALGAIMDVAVSVAAALRELSKQIPGITFTNILSSGVAIGRDMMGTMANTLILAYIGSSLSLTLLLVAYNHSLLELFNREMIVVEVLQALVGSFGILLTIPLTSTVCATLYTNDWKEPDHPPATVGQTPQ